MPVLSFAEELARAKAALASSHVSVARAAGSRDARAETREAHSDPEATLTAPSERVAADLMTKPSASERVSHRGPGFDAAALTRRRSDPGASETLGRATDHHAPVPAPKHEEPVHENVDQVEGGPGMDESTRARAWRSIPNARLSSVRQWLHEPLAVDGEEQGIFQHGGEGDHAATSAAAARHAAGVARSVAHEVAEQRATAGKYVPMSPAPDFSSSSGPDGYSHARSPPLAAVARAPQRRLARSRLRLATAPLREEHPRQSSPPRRSEAPRSRLQASPAPSQPDRVAWLMQLMASYKELQLLYERYYQHNVRRLLDKNRVYRGLLREGTWHVHPPMPPHFDAAPPSRESLLPAYGALSSFATNELEQAIADLASARALAAVSDMPAIMRRTDEDVEARDSAILVDRLRAQQRELEDLRAQVRRQAATGPPAPGDADASQVHLHIHTHDRDGTDSSSREVPSSLRARPRTAAPASSRAGASSPIRTAAPRHAPGSTGRYSTSSPTRGWEESPADPASSSMSPLTLAKQGYRLARDVEDVQAKFSATMARLNQLL